MPRRGCLELDAVVRGMQYYSQAGHAPRKAFLRAPVPMNRFTREFRSAALAWAAAATIQSNVVHNTIAIQIKLNSTLRFRAPREVLPFIQHMAFEPMSLLSFQSSQMLVGHVASKAVPRTCIETNHHQIFGTLFFCLKVFFHVHVSQAPIATDTGQPLMVWGKEIFE
jgi:hypothetical protein